ncbi:MULTISPECIES: FadR/GntR family transcriptional regulator [unclassified Arenibacter]|jgi:DNA-binding FadR family transcriptional regulator|uniref:FadR/GntR family transcriptional regulator n=1 Tax=unclassified Arenibacter TaxID=2615047 RepID=UPI000E346BB1|nr:MULTISPECIES: FCD domain-containing protein [unclassified Arenibacter]MCM4162480.1 FadR family transcriptional regulator [Arenibacter sp. A80]RFT58067.1 FadR family transcriptional regulator [Arenibacter sp. P308M17]
MSKLNKIEPLDNLSLVDKAEIRILKFFKENKLKPGDAIPKELEFSEAFGVSRTVVREALLRLRTLGIIDSKKHRGMVLTRPDIINNFERILDPTLLGDDTLRNLFELRLIMEMGIADFLFEHKTQKDMDELERIVTLEEETSYEKDRFSLDREIAFHGKLYQMSNNATVQRFQSLLLPVFEYVYLEEAKKNKTDYQYSSGQFVTHRMLMDNLRVGTPETYRSAMRRHLEPHFDHALRNGRK